MIRSSLFRPIISGLFLALALAQTAPAAAAQRDLEMLQTYVGEWSGRGTMDTANGEETVVCSLKVVSARASTVTFDGKCAFAGARVSLKGAMGFVEERNRFEAVLNSDVGFLQDKVAIGKRSGSGIVFTMRPTDPETNAEIDVAVDLALKNGVITFNAKLTDVASGAKTSAKVPLEKKS